ncbi:MAG: DNA replication/repair protein RecF [Candidatus Zixiibacteriota bacterium]
MKVSSITLQNFRNFPDLSLTFSPGVNILSGPNGSGKTNLLEALETLCLGRSQRLNATDSTLITQASDFFRLEGKLSSDKQEFSVSVAFQATSPARGKRVFLNEQPTKLSELFRIASLVVLSPEDSAIVSGAPSLRRKFLDLHLSQSSIRYLDDLTHYQRTLNQRNSHLRQFGIGSEGTPFDDQLIEYGSSITRTRSEFLQDISNDLNSIYRTLDPGVRCLCRYLPSALLSTSERAQETGPEQSGTVSQRLELESIQESFRRRLQARQSQEARREVSLVGPHRDDFELWIGDLPARTHGSQGEWRSLVIALKLAVFTFLRHRRGESPLLLLDEVFAELDDGRQRALIDSFGELGQLFLTTALEPPAAMASGALILQVEGGRVSPF